MINDLRFMFTEAEIRDVLARVDGFLTGLGIKAYLVGGVVRDTLLGRETGDIDIAVTGDALDVAAKVANELGGHYVLLDEKNRVARVVYGECTLDFSTIEESIEEDLSRRDFTINAMAINLHELITGKGEPKITPHLHLSPKGRETGVEAARLIDPFGGVKDLRNGVVRALNDNVFAADAARLLRAVRIAGELSFRISRNTEKLIKRDVHLLAGVAGERVREELLRLLGTPKEPLLFYLDKLGLLTAVFPELAAGKGVEQPVEHFWDVFTHSLKTAEAVDFLLRRGSWEYDREEVLATVPWSEELEKHFAEEVGNGSTRRSLLKLAGLLHDIAKPETKAVIEGRIRFLGHDKDGASAVAGILGRLRFSTREIKLVETGIRYHMRPGQMTPKEGLPTPRAIYRYFRDTGEAGIDILFLNLADHLAARGPTLDLTHWRENVRMVEYVLSERSRQESTVLPPKLVDGNDLMEIFGLEPGPEIGRLLEAVKEEQAVGKVKTREEALALVKSKLKSQRSNREVKSKNK